MLFPLRRWRHTYGHFCHTCRSYFNSAQLCRRAFHYCTVIPLSNSCPAWRKWNSPPLRWPFSPQVGWGNFSFVTRVSHLLCPLVPPCSPNPQLLRCFAGLAGLLQVAVVLAHDRPPMYDADSIACYTLMDRQDLVRLQLAARVQRAKGPLALPPVCRFSTGSRRAVHTPSNGIAWNALTALRFSLDHRLREVERLLNSSVTNWVRVKQEPGMTDHFLLAEQQSRLLAISLRTMAMSVGRGMAVLNTAEPLITQALHVPELELRGRLHPLGSHFELDSNTVSPAVKQWPFFHNGVAAALRLCPRGGSKASITAWLARHDIAGSAEATAQHAGLLMGLGLTGHLLELGSVTLHSFLSKCHEPTSVGILLGLAAAKHASMDADIVRVLSIHVPSLLPPSSAEVDVDLMVQAAAMVGLGLVYEGSCHRRMIEMMLLEMGRPPPLTVSGTLDRESYALASGIGLGLVLLGKVSVGRRGQKSQIARRFFKTFSFFFNRVALRR